MSRPASQLRDRLLGAVEADADLTGLVTPAQAVDATLTELAQWLRDYALEQYPSGGAPAMAIAYLADNVLT